MLKKNIDFTILFVMMYKAKENYLLHKIWGHKKLFYSFAGFEL